MSIIITIQAAIEISGSGKSNHVIAFDPITLKLTELCEHNGPFGDSPMVIPKAILEEAITQELLHPREEAFWKTYRGRGSINNASKEVKKRFAFFLRTYVSIEFPQNQTMGPYGKFSLYIRSLGPNSRLSTPRYKLEGELTSIQGGSPVSFMDTGSSLC